MADHRPSDKYKQFRNFMFNELGITKDDIMQWTREAAREAADIKLREVLAKDEIGSIIHASVRNHLVGQSRFAMDRIVEKTVKEAVADRIAGRVVVTLREEG